MAASHLLALDVGEKRIGVALAHPVARIAQPYATLENSAAIFSELQAIIEREGVQQVVVGLPRGLNGQETAQTAAVQAFGQQLISHLKNVTIVWQDEALTSRKAEAELSRRKGQWNKSEIDALAASYILEDYLLENAEGTR